MNQVVWHFNFMAGLYDAYEHPKERIKRGKVKYNHRRFYTRLDMSIIKHDESVHNAKAKRGEVADENNGLIYECGCGAVGCFIHRSYKASNPNKAGIELLHIINNKNKLNKPKKDELNELVILRDGFDPKTSFKK